MIELIELLQTEMHSLLGQLGDCLRQVQNSDQADEASARWVKRSQALTGAISVLARQPFSNLGAAMQLLGRDGGAVSLKNPLAATALKLIGEFVEVPARQAEDWLDANSERADALGLQLGEAAEHETAPAAEAEVEA